MKLLATRPYGHQSVWIGYDPASTGDASGCAVIAPPTVAGGKFRVLERFQWHGMDFAQQARQIQTLTPRSQRATYVTNRAEGTSHGDVAWAIMHALFNEPLAGITANNRSFMEIF